MRKHLVLPVWDKVPCPSVPSRAPEHCDSAVTPLQAWLAMGRVRERRHQIPEIRYCSSDTLCWLPLHPGLFKGGQLTAREQGWKFEVLVVSSTRGGLGSRPSTGHTLLVSLQKPFLSLILFPSPGFSLSPLLAQAASPQMAKENHQVDFRAFVEEKNWAGYFFLLRTAKRPKKASQEHLREDLKCRRKGRNAL